VTTLLARQGFESIEAGNADSAFSMAQKDGQISLLLTDINMPGSIWMVLRLLAP
jgi:CheY-like chemotaxis protein